jgi:hypothetical protein
MLFDSYLDYFHKIIGSINHSTINTLQILPKCHIYKLVNHRQRDEVGVDSIRFQAPAWPSPSQLPRTPLPAASGFGLRVLEKERFMRHLRRPYGMFIRVLALIALVAAFPGIASAQLASAEIPENARARSFGSGWVCERGYRESDGTCEAVRLSRCRATPI